MTVMSIDSEALLRDALTLPASTRAAVAAELIASLDEDAIDDPAAAERAWAEELEARAGRARSGEDPGQAWSAVRDRMRNKLAR